MSELLDTLPWTKHVIREGSREHVTIFGMLEGPDTLVPITWCTNPFCDGNRVMVEWLMGKGLDPIAAQPPPRLTEALRALLHEGQG